ncbi:hypothetical protein [uncultured Selenomonas sp.]|uniref:hypothetical protein n=1 Tax=uncultured Selenomonas sp. TaxID=159275 RepID=UPI0025FE37D4|nr:hypothetical protein [uncultured Selenomonas sp.]
MKKFFCGFLMMLTMLLVSAPASLCSAADVWVAHWNSENIDIYVIDDTLRYDSSQPGHYFFVDAKEVRNGYLLRTVRWEYSKFRNDAWRYQTDTMRGNHTTVAIPRDGIFEYCMGQLGWSYYIENSRYY